ncbi:MAG: radical SAM protein [Deltaproteobacteria bacterium]|nr:MAG: radical SAM protein [Deltaproteobacteria bacterium]
MVTVQEGSARLSPFVGALRADVEAALRPVLGLGDRDPVRLECRGEALVVEAGGGHVELRGVSPSARRAGAPLSARLDALPRDSRRQVASALRAVPPPALGRLAEALDRWWPYAGLDDSEFRQLASSPEGLHGMVRLGYRCNQDCWFCWQDRRGPAPPRALVERWLDELAELGVEEVHITGGEPTTWQELPDLVERAARLHGMRVVVQTNAVRLSRRSYAVRLADAGVIALHVSLHAGTADVSDRMTRAPGTWARTVEGVINALSVGLRVTLNCVVEAENVDRLPEHARFVRDRIAGFAEAGRVARVTYSHPTGYHQDGLWAASQVPFDRVRGPLSRAVAILREAGIPVEVGGSSGFALCVLDPDIVDARVRIVQRGTYEEGELDHRRFAKACAACADRSSCFGLRQEYLDAFGESGLVPRIDGGPVGPAD